MLLTRKAIMSLKTKKGGFRAHVVAALGEKIVSGWIDRLVGREFPEEQYQRLLLLRDAKKGMAKKFNPCFGLSPKAPVQLPPEEDIRFFEGKMLSEDQVSVIKSVFQERGPIFVAGKAGSGKSLVVRLLKKTYPGCTVSAMTGVAAQVLDARTAASVLGIKPSPGGGEELFPSKRSRNLPSVRLLIIDEISMANKSFLGLVRERFVETFGEDTNYWPKLVVVGDLLQLPPVGGIPAFKSFGHFKVLHLTSQHRQDPSDKGFLEALNEIRVGVISAKAKELLQTRIVEELPNSCVHLHAKNVDVDATNRQRLGELSGMPYLFTRKIDVIDDGAPEFLFTNAINNSRLQKTLLLKPGARVVLLTNQNEGKWVNGSTGEVLSIDETDETVSVRLDKGGEVRVERCREEIFRDDDDEYPIGYLSQIPIKLAWAMTIHRAQGSTLDRVGIDMNDHFETGMTYVALSRCSSLDGLFLKGTIPDSVLVDREAISFLENNMNKQV